MGIGDALLTNVPGLQLSVRTADCLPVIFVDVESRAVAIAHAGWRGTAARIAQRVVLLMQQVYGTRLESLQVAIGPGIDKCCYEVGLEVIEAMGCYSPLAPPVETAPGKYKISLAEVVFTQLVDSGVQAQNIHLGAPCTYCSGTEFYSWRREGTAAGRMVNVVAIRPS